MREESFKAWAIDTRSEEGHGFIGRYYWYQNLPDSSEGCELALFLTKAKAMKYLPQAREAFPKAQVARVLITVKILKYS